MVILAIKDTEKRGMGEFFKSNAAQILQALVLGLVGLTVGVAQVLSTDPPMTRRKAIGKMLISGGIGMAASSILVWLPDIPLAAQMGVAAALASLGLSGIELVLRRAVGGGRATDLIDAAEKAKGSEK